MTDKKRGSLVVSALAFNARGHGFDPRDRRGEKFRCPKMLSLVSFAEMSLNKCAVLRIGTLTGDIQCRLSHPLCRFRNPTVFYSSLWALILQNRCVQCTPAIILERGCSSMYRKKDKTQKEILPFLYDFVVAMVTTMW